MDQNTEHEISSKFTNLTEAEGNKIQPVQWLVLSWCYMFYSIFFLSREVPFLGGRSFFLRDDKVSAKLLGWRPTILPLRWLRCGFSVTELFLKPRGGQTCYYLWKYYHFLRVWRFETRWRGFVLVGWREANIVPVFFTAAGRIKNVPAQRLFQ